MRMTQRRCLRGNWDANLQLPNRHRAYVSRCARIRACALRRRHPDIPDGYAVAGPEGEDAVPSQPSWPARAMTRVRGVSLIANYKYKYKYVSTIVREREAAHVHASISGHRLAVGPGPVWASVGALICE